MRRATCAAQQRATENSRCDAVDYSQTRRSLPKADDRPLPPKAAHRMRAIGGSASNGEPGACAGAVTTQRQRPFPSASKGRVKRQASVPSSHIGNRGSNHRYSRLDYRYSYWDYRYSRLDYRYSYLDRYGLFIWTTKAPRARVRCDPAGSAPSASKNVGVRSHRARACAAGSAARPPRLRSSCPHSATKPASRCSRMARRRRRSCVRRRSTAALARVRRRCLRVCLLLCRRHARRWRSVLNCRAAASWSALQRVACVASRHACRNVQQ